MEVKTAHSGCRLIPTNPKNPGPTIKNIFYHEFDYAIQTRKLLMG
jgi:hypothetical protein